MQLKLALLVISSMAATALAQHHLAGHENHHVGYNYQYGVKDPHTHDVHSQQEHREGDNVVGEYTLLEADGTQRIVKYRAGPHIGFEAYVERNGHAQHPAYYGKHGEKGGQGGTSYVGATHWNNQGPEEHYHH
ncbi:cuticle protein 19-like [Anoplophora glabripennis]|uniref:cuticle protein 19-like n=1 Tax=Anoplophora glabripennis TaxID=217634 RepID=UPI000873C0D2|nr:cuticle protein 19-like [Anoplophora glabripennis]